MIFLISCCWILGQGCTNVANNDPPKHQQALIVLTEGWDSLQSTVYAVEWQDGAWRMVRRHAAVVGQRGLGWGSGVVDFTNREGPVKEEGDKKSPAGVFRIGTAFGRFPKDSLPPLKLSYQQIVYELQCIEDPSSDFYNRLMMETDPEKDWEQNDRMLREDDLYDLGAFVNHNTNPATPGGGSCIFLHLWRHADEGTLGCTAMDGNILLEHLKWLNPDKDPVLVQIPAGQYAALAETFQLPPTPNL